MWSVNIKPVAQKSIEQGDILFVLPQHAVDVLRQLNVPEAFIDRLLFNVWNIEKQDNGLYKMEYGIEWSRNTHDPDEGFTRISTSLDIKPNPSDVLHAFAQVSADILNDTDKEQLLEAVNIFHEKLYQFIDHHLTFYLAVGNE